MCTDHHRHGTMSHAVTRVMREPAMNRPTRRPREPAAVSGLCCCAASSFCDRDTDAEEL